MRTTCGSQSQWRTTEVTSSAAPWRVSPVDPSMPSALDRSAAVLPGLGRAEALGVLAKLEASCGVRGVAVELGGDETASSSPPRCWLPAGRPVEDRPARSQELSLVVRGTSGVSGAPAAPAAVLVPEARARRDRDPVAVADLLERGEQLRVRAGSEHRGGKWLRRLDVDPAVLPQAGGRRDELADDHVLLEPEEAVDLALDRGVGEHLRRLLEGGGREERLGRERGLGDPEDERLERSLLASLRRPGTVVGALEHDLVDELARQQLGEPGVSTRTFFIIWRTMSSMCLSWMSTPCDL